MEKSLVIWKNIQVGFLFIHLQFTCLRDNNLHCFNFIPFFREKSIFPTFSFTVLPIVGHFAVMQEPKLFVNNVKSIVLKIKKKSKTKTEKKPLGLPGAC